jgi:hypothetical protein
MGSQVLSACQKNLLVIHIYILAMHVTSPSSTDALQELDADAKAQSLPALFPRTYDKR